MINPFYDARETINHFKLNLGWDVYAISVRGVKSNNKSLQSGTRWWFNEHKLFVDDIFFSEDKDKIVRNLKLDLFVEDKPESIESIGKVYLQQINLVLNFLLFYPYLRRRK